MNDVEKCAQAIDLVQLPGEGGGQVETESVDMHFQNPVTQAIHD